MLSNKDIGFDVEKQELTINGETYKVGDQGALDDLAEVVARNETAIRGLDGRVTALEDGSGEYARITSGSGNSVQGAIYTRINVDVTDYKDFCILAKKQGSSDPYHIIYVAGALVSHEQMVGDGTFGLRRWSASDPRLGIGLIEAGQFDYILYAK